MKKLFFLFFLGLGLAPSGIAQNRACLTMVGQHQNLAKLQTKSIFQTAPKFAIFQKQKVWNFLYTEVIEKHQALQGLETRAALEQQLAFEFIDKETRYLILLIEKGKSTAANPSYLAYLYYLNREMISFQQRWEQEISALKTCWEKQLEQLLEEHLGQLTIDATTAYLIAQELVAYRVNTVEDWTEEILQQLAPDLGFWRNELEQENDCWPELAKTPEKLPFLSFKEFKTLYLD